MEPSHTSTLEELVPVDIEKDIDETDAISLGTPEPSSDEEEEEEEGEDEEEGAAEEGEEEEEAAEEGAAEEEAAEEGEEEEGEEEEGAAEDEEEYRKLAEKPNNIPCVGYHKEIVERANEPEHVDMYIHPPPELLHKYPSLKEKDILTEGGRIRSKQDGRRYLDKLKELKLELPENCISTDFLRFTSRKSELSEEERKLLRAAKWIKEKALAASEEVVDSPIDEETDEEDESEDENAFKKLEQDVQREYLEQFHPETKQINFSELLALSKVTRNGEGRIIDILHTTLPFMTKYERTRILGLRTTQINNGSEIFVSVDKDVIDGYVIAELELKAKKVPFIIRRPLPNGASEYWRIEDLEIINY